MGFKDYLVLDRADIPDGPWSWDVDAVQKQILIHIQQKKKDGIDIRTIVTFDKLGVSAHPNHISTFHASKKYFDEYSEGIDLYTL